MTLSILKHYCRSFYSKMSQNSTRILFTCLNKRADVLSIWFMRHESNLGLPLESFMDTLRSATFFGKHWFSISRPPTIPALTKSILATAPIMPKEPITHANIIIARWAKSEPGICCIAPLKLIIIKIMKYLVIFVFTYNQLDLILIYFYQNKVHKVLENY